jgi:SAM-dependent methyltransferase
MIDRTLRENARVVQGLSARPRRALEVGALPSRFCVLSSPEAADIHERIGLNLNESGTAPGGVVVHAGDARAMPFDDAHFDLIVCASTLEHIPDFWKAVAEMHRVLAPGGTLVVSTPGYRRYRGELRLQRLAARLRLPDVLQRGTVTMRVHDSRDYYRFSEDSYREVIMAGLEHVSVWSIMTPPRIYATGRKPQIG